MVVALRAWRPAGAAEIPASHLPARRPRPVVPRVPSAAALLSLREREIAELVVCGLSNKEIAQELGISHWTVSTHLRRIFAKLDISRRVELCRLVEASPPRR